MDTRFNFHQSLAELQKDLLRMGGEVERLIRQAVDALARMDEQLAQQTVAQDDAIDRMMLAIEERCLRLIALQQPMAVDLRVIGMALKIATDLERIADHAVDIAKIAVRLSGERLVKPLVDIPQMAELALAMLRESLAAYAGNDVQQAAALADKEDEVDRLYGSIFHEIVGMMASDYAANRQLTHLLMAALCLERVADHATNIGEGVIYMVTGKRTDLNI